ncbi:hypothetical protein CF319_g3029 [Tilletia indica]|nr:hypothetical protein CF319_g3029 [Tilletia indica]
MFRQITQCLFPCCIGSGVDSDDEQEANYGAVGDERTPLLHRFSRKTNGGPSSSSRNQSPAFQAQPPSSSSSLATGPGTGRSPRRGGPGLQTGLGYEGEDDEVRQNRPHFPLSPDVLKKITQTTQQNFLVISSSGRYVPEDLDRRSATSAGAGGGTDGGRYDRRSIISGGTGTGGRAESAAAAAAAAAAGGSGANATILPAPTAATPRRGVPGTPVGQRQPSSELERSMLARLEADSVLSGPIVEGWPEDE